MQIIKGMKNKLLFYFGLCFLIIASPAFSDPNIFLYSPNVEKGTAIVVKILSETEPKIFFGNERIKPLLINGDYAVIIPIDLADPREHDFLDITLGDKPNVYTIYLQEFKSRTRTLTFRARNRRYYPPKAKEIAEAEKRLKQESQIMEVRNIFHPNVYFENKFSYPIKKYHKKLYFGDFRLVKRGKKKYSYYHRGLDFAIRKGTPVHASNSGRVVVARRLATRGKTVVIDHGLGIYSEYLHLSRFHVKTGQFVKRGQMVGRVGSTGMSTGPHLHWSMIVRGVLINPSFLTNPVMDEIFSKNSSITKKQLQKNHKLSKSL